MTPCPAPGRARGRLNGGFTLIEVLIVVVVIGILVSIGYPAYVDQMVKARRAEAHNALMDLASRQERFFNDNRTYTADMAALGFGADPYITPGGYYSVDAAAGGTGIATSYIATATRRASQASDTVCGDYRLNSAGRTTVVNATAPAEDCW
jgi:type IV pilus assembly protein PilE